jgi:uncharacterized protein YrrD
MQLIKNADVFSAAGERIGTLDRVVLDPESKDVTHIVVEKGILFTTNKVIPIQSVNLQDEARIVLKQTEAELEELPSYNEAAYVELAPHDYPYDNVNAVYWYPPLPVQWQSMADPMWAPTSKPALIQQEVIPEGTVALKQGAAVMSQDEKFIGNVELVILDPDGHITHIVVGEGIFLKQKKLVPAHWIKNVDTDKVDLTVWSDLFDQLPDYESEAQTLKGK